MNLLEIYKTTKDTYGVDGDGINSTMRRTGKAAGFSFTRATDLSPGVDPFAGMNWMNGYDVITEYDSGTSKQKITAYQGTALFDQKLADGIGNRINIKENCWYRRMYADKLEASPKRFAGSEPLYKFGNVVPDKVGFTVYNAADPGDGTIASRPGLPTLVNLNLLQYNQKYVAQGMYAMDFNTMSALQILAQIKYANRNVQAVLGGGISNTYTGDGSTAAEKAQISETGVKRIIVTNAQAAKFALGDRVTLTGITFWQCKITAIDTYDASNKAITIDAPAVFNTVSGITGIRRAVNGTGGSDAIQGSCGMVTGTDGKADIKMLGLENFYGNAWVLLSAAFRYNNTEFYLHTDKLDMTAWPTTIEEALAQGYQKINAVLPTANGYINGIVYDDDHRNMFLPTSIGGASDRPVGDYFATVAGNGFYIAPSGGNLSFGSNDGPFCVYLSNGLTNAYWSCSSFGLYLPE